MKKFLLVDVMNLMWRSAHVTRGDAFTRSGLALHIMLTSLTSVAQKFNIDHIVVAFDGSSWRKKYDPLYKLNRKVKANARSADEVEFHDYMMDVLSDFQIFLKDKTNVSVLAHPSLEADDLIAGWIQTHPSDYHIILSSDSDFKQLISDNVVFFNGMEKTLTTRTAVLQENGKPKEKNGKAIIPDDPEYFLFEKIIRGDTSDNIHSAYPGVRKKGTKNKVGIIQAFADRHDQGYDWQNFMAETWTDHNGNQNLVHDRYKHNQLLIDLTKQPDDIKVSIAETIAGVYETTDKKSQVGIHFIKFCGKHDLVNMANMATQVSTYLNKGLT